jgi:hypothetical protein
MTWVLRHDYTRVHAKTGECRAEHDYYVGDIMGIAHECSHDIAKAKTFRTKALAEVFARNKGMTRRKAFRVPTDAA